MAVHVPTPEALKVPALGLDLTVAAVGWALVATLREVRGVLPSLAPQAWRPVHLLHFWPEPDAEAPVSWRAAYAVDRVLRASDRPTAPTWPAPASPPGDL